MARCDIELLDDVDDSGVHVAKSFRINGEEINLPPDVSFTITAGPEQATIVSLQLMATSLRIGQSAVAEQAKPGRWPGSGKERA